MEYPDLYADQCTFDDSSVHFGSSAGHTVRALDLRTGRERRVFCRPIPT